MADNGQAVIELDRKRMDAMCRGDAAALEDLLADDLVYTHSSARLDTKRSLIDGMTNGAAAYQSMDTSDVKAVDCGDTVVLTGRADIRVVARGNPLTLNVRFTDVWARRGGQWQMVAWQSTKLAE
jgi:ketosteroid isomerase-like protein